MNFLAFLTVIGLATCGSTAADAGGHHFYVSSPLDWHVEGREVGEPTELAHAAVLVLSDHGQVALFQGLLRRRPDGELAFQFASGFNLWVGRYSGTQRGKVEVPLAIVEQTVRDLNGPTTMRQYWRFEGDSLLGAKEIQGDGFRFVTLLTFKDAKRMADIAERHWKQAQWAMSRRVVPTGRHASCGSSSSTRGCACRPPSRVDEQAALRRAGWQYRAFAGIPHGRETHRLFEDLVGGGFATAIPTGAPHAGRIYHIRYKPWYRALGVPDHPHRRTMSLGRAVERLMVLDAVLAEPDVTWLGLSRDKVGAFTAAPFCVALDALPHTPIGGVVRPFPDPCPIGLAPDGTCLFLYLITAPRPTTFRTFLTRHLALLSALPSWCLRLLLPPALSAVRERYLRAARGALQPLVHDGVDTRVEIVRVTPSYLRLESLVGTAWPPAHRAAGRPEGRGPENISSRGP